MLLSSPAVNSLELLSLKVTEVTGAACLIVIVLRLVLVSQTYIC